MVLHYLCYLPVFCSFRAMRRTKFGYRKERSDIGMVKPQKVGKNVRMSFSKIDEALEMPNLIEVQKKSYKWFLEEGLYEVFEDIISEVDGEEFNFLLE